MRKKTNRINKLWNKTDLEFLINNYGKITVQEIADKLKVRYYRVSNKAKKLKLKSKLRKQVDKAIINTVESKFKVKKYPNNKFKNKIEVECPFCKTDFQSKPSTLARKGTISCGCVHLKWRKGTKYVSSTFWGKVVSNAKKRRLELAFDINYLEDLIIKQDFKCIFTGWNIECGYTKNFTASLDRIDSTKGYIKGNVQFVHKKVNIAKNSLSDDEFLEIIDAIYLNRIKNK